MSNPDTPELDILELDETAVSPEQTEDAEQNENEEVALHIDEITAEEEDEMKTIGVIEKQAA